MICLRNTQLFSTYIFLLAKAKMYARNENCIDTVHIYFTLSEKIVDRNPNSCWDRKSYNNHTLSAKSSTHTIRKKIEAGKLILILFQCPTNINYMHYNCFLRESTIPNPLIIFVRGRKWLSYFICNIF